MYFLCSGKAKGIFDFSCSKLFSNKWSMEDFRVDHPSDLQYSKILSTGSATDSTK